MMPSLEYSLLWEREAMHMQLANRIMHLSFYQPMLLAAKVSIALLSNPVTESTLRSYSVTQSKDVTKNVAEKIQGLETMCSPDAVRVFII